MIFLMPEGVLTVFENSVQECNYVDFHTDNLYIVIPSLILKCLLNATIKHYFGFVYLKESIDFRWTYFGSIT